MEIKSSLLLLLLLLLLTFKNKDVIGYLINDLFSGRRRRSENSKSVYKSVIFKRIVLSVDVWIQGLHGTGTGFSIPGIIDLG